MAKCDDQSRTHDQRGSATETKMSLSALRLQGDLWYRIQVLLFDLSNVENSSSRSRLGSTTNELYISGPYFTSSEANQILTSIVDSAQRIKIEDMLAANAGQITRMFDADPTEVTNSGDVPDTIFTTDEMLTLERAIQAILSNFFEKRKASGDARPCGPYDLIPIYTAVFGISKEELKEECFLSRLRRSGLGNVHVKQESGKLVQAKSDGKGKKKNTKKVK